MPTLQELQRQVRKLKEDKSIKQKQLKSERDKKQKLVDIKNKSIRDFKNIQEEKARLQRQIKRLSNPKSTEFKRVLKRGIRTGGKSTLSVLRTAGKKSLPTLKKIKKNLDRASVEWQKG